MEPPPFRLPHIFSEQLDSTEQKEIRIPAFFPGMHFPVIFPACLSYFCKAASIQPAFRHKKMKESVQVSRKSHYFTRHSRLDSSSTNPPKFSTDCFESVFISHLSALLNLMSRESASRSPAHPLPGHAEGQIPPIFVQNPSSPKSHVPRGRITPGSPFYLQTQILCLSLNPSSTIFT